MSLSLLKLIQLADMAEYATLSFSLHLYPFGSPFSLSFMIFFPCFLQYNEILGKGASKTVYA